MTNICSGRYGAYYNFYINRPWLALKIFRLALGIDAASFYESMDVVADLQDGAVVLDAPCGGGVALKAVRPEQSLRYLGLDISERMLVRFKRRAVELGIQVETLEADLRSIPLPDGAADCCLSYQGLHMLSEPRRGLSEIVRCLKPGGRLVGATFVAEGNRRQRLQLNLAERGGASGVAPKVADLKHWLDAASIEEVSVSPERGLAIFTGRKAGGIS